MKKTKNKYNVKQISKQIEKEPTLTEDQLIRALKGANTIMNAPMPWMAKCMIETSKHIAQDPAHNDQNVHKKILLLLKEKNIYKE